MFFQLAYFFVMVTTTSPPAETIVSVRAWHVMPPANGDEPKDGNDLTSHRGSCLIVYRHNLVRPWPIATRRLELYT